MGKVLLTMMGRSAWGLFNSVWSDIRQFDYLPDKVYVLTAGCEAARGQMAKDMLTVLLREHGSKGDVELVDVQGHDIKEIGQQVNEIIGAENARGNEVAVDHIFYLYIASLQNASRPYLEIPLDLQSSHDLLREVR
jgi:hypothetical protein